jgi:HAD superfamily hydrolase (TIGR01549 family)
METQKHETIVHFDQVKAVIFDLDGTLLDSFSVHYEVFEMMFAAFGIRIEKQKFLNAYSPNWYEVYKAMGLPQDQWQAANDLWLEEAQKRDPLLFSDTLGVLTKLRDSYLLGLVTSGSKSRVEKDLNRTGIKKYFKTIVTGDDIENPKPHPEGLEIAMREMGVTPKNTIYVGDAYDDFKMAAQAGVTFIGVSSEFASLNRNHLEYQICHLKEIPVYLGMARTD